MRQPIFRCRTFANPLMALCAVGLFLNIYRSLYHDAWLSIPVRPIRYSAQEDEDSMIYTHHSDGVHSSTSSSTSSSSSTYHPTTSDSLPHPPPQVTTAECRQEGTVCEYRNLCFDGQAFVILVDDSKGPGPSNTEETWADPTRDYYDLHLKFTDKNALIPIASRWLYKAMPASKVFGPKVHTLPFHMPDNTSISITPEMTANGPTVIWLNGSFYSQGADTKGHGCYNPYHWSIGTTPLWRAQFRNTSARTNSANWLSYSADGQRELNPYDATQTVGILPPMDYVFSLCGREGQPYSEGIVRAVVPKDTKIIWNRNLGAYNYEFDEPANHADPTTWRGFDQTVSTAGVGNLALQPQKRLLCAKRAVMLSFRYTMFSDSVEWRTMRMQVLNSLNLAHLAYPTKPPPQVIFKRSGRDLANIDALIKVCNKYTKCVKSSAWDHRTSFETQVSEVASSGIFVGVHGAGMANAMWLPPNGAMIEIFPYKWWPDMFRNMAAEMRIPYFMVTTYERPAKQTDDSCAGASAPAYTVGACAHGSKYEKFWVSPRLFERTLLDALQLIGINAEPEGNEIESPTPSPSASPKTAAPVVAEEGANNNTP